MNMTDPHLVSMIFTAIEYALKSRNRGYHLDQMKLMTFIPSTDNNGLIELNEWLVYASIVSKGSHDERMKFQFNVFDSNKVRLLSVLQDWVIVIHLVS